MEALERTRGSVRQSGRSGVEIELGERPTDPSRRGPKWPSQHSSHRGSRRLDAERRHHLDGRQFGELQLQRLRVWAIHCPSLPRPRRTQSSAVASKQGVPPSKFRCSATRSGRSDLRRKRSISARQVGMRHGIVLELVASVVYELFSIDWSRVGRNHWCPLPQICRVPLRMLPGRAHQRSICGVDGNG
jgi:hypothetical protein